MDLFLKNEEYLNGEYFVTSEDYFAVCNYTPTVEGLCWEYDIIEKINRNEDGYFDFSKGIIDIGAEDGGYAIFCNFDKGYCFEPNKQMCALIWTNMYLKNKINDIEVYNVFLGDKEDEIMFNGFSSEGGVNYDIRGRQKPVKVKEHLLDEYNIKNVGFIKTDTEGFDYFVLKGGINTIINNNYPPILFENWEIGYREGSDAVWSKENHDRLDNFIESLGYTIFKQWGSHDTHLAVKLDKDEFPSKPIPFCSYCDNNKNTQCSGEQIELAQTKYNINECRDNATFVLQNYVKPTFINVKNGCCNSSFFKHNDKIYLLARRTNYSFISGNTLDMFKFNCNAAFSEENIYSYNEHTKTYDFYKNVSNVSLEDRERYEVKGDEDFRIMNCDGKMLVNFTRVEHVKHFQGWGFSHLAEFDDELNVVNDFALPTDRFIEKNWQPIENKMYEYVYSYNPFSILNVKTGEWNVNYDLCLETICGSSPVMKYKGYYITIVHNRDIYVDKKRKNYFHYLILFDENLNLLKMSNPFKFFGCDIEFSTYMGIIDDKINILASVNEQLTYKFVLDDEIIEKILDCSLFDNSICENLYDELFFDALKVDNSIAAVCFGTFSNNACVKKIALNELENVFIENDKYNLIKNILCSNNNHYVISMTTIPSRKKRIKDNIESILGQSWQGFYKYCINIDDNLSEEDYAFYESLKELDERIEINICDNKWRSCNKLLPTLKKYPDDVIITVDDDICYGKDCLKYLVEEHEKNPDCVIAHEINPIIVKDGKFESFVNVLDLKLGQKEFGKYLSNCCLFPPHIFDNTDLFDYDKMMYCTKGTHDELWFWLMSTINGYNVIGLNYVREFGCSTFKDTYSDGYRLTDINNNDLAVGDYCDRIKKMYGNKLNAILGKEKIKFVITKDNIYNLFYNFWIVRNFYDENFVLDVSQLDTSYLLELSDFLNGSGINLEDVKM